MQQCMSQDNVCYKTILRIVQQQSAKYNANFLFINKCKQREQN